MLEPSIEVDARPSSIHIFELSAHPSPRPPFLVAVAPALPEEMRPLDPLADATPSTASTTNTIPPASVFLSGRAAGKGREIRCAEDVRFRIIHGWSFPLVLGDGVRP